jgi:hypothetical protein
MSVSNEAVEETPVKATKTSAKPAKAKATPKAKTTVKAKPAKKAAPKVSKKQSQTVRMIEILRASNEAIEFSALAEQVGQKYSQDIVAAVYALEAVGCVERSAEGPAAYKWVGAAA